MIKTFLPFNRVHPPARERDALMRKNLQLPLWKGIPNHTLHSAAHMHGLRIEGGFARRPVRESGLSPPPLLYLLPLISKEEEEDDKDWGRRGGLC